MVLLPPPLFPGLLGPLEAAVGGLAGEGQTPRSGPRLGTPPAAYLSTPGRPPSPRLPLRGLCGDPRGSAATLCGPAPAPGPSGAFPCAKASFRADGGLSPPPALPVPWERRCYRRRSHGRQRGLPTSLLLSPEAALTRPPIATDWWSFGTGLPTSLPWTTARSRSSFSSQTITGL